MRTPIDQNLNLRKWENSTFSENENLNFISVAGISVRNLDRKIRQYHGYSLDHKCSDTRFGKILQIIREDTTLQKCIKMGV